MNLKELSVAMVEPTYSINIGYVARVMKNFGLSRLLIVGRRKLTRTAKLFASHGEDIINGCEFLTLDEIFARYTMVIGTTAIVKKGDNAYGKAVSPERAARIIKCPSETVILLGRDTTGLTSDELSRCDVVLTIRTGTSYPTLNISHALSIILYALYKHKSKSTVDYLSRTTRQIMFRYLESLISKSISQSHKRSRLLRVFKKLINESDINERQAASLIGFFRKLDSKF